MTPGNILRHPPVRRNPLLAEVLQAIGLVNRAGLGVDRIYDELLRLGKAPPRFHADEAHVHLTLGLTTDRPFAAFVAQETREGRELELDDLLLLRAVVEAGRLNRFSASEVLQVSEQDASDRLVSLRRRGYLSARGRGRGTSYHLMKRLSDRLRGSDETNRDLPLDEAAVLLRVQQILVERGSLTNADVRRIAGYTRDEALQLLQRLRDAGLAEIRGAGRGAHYVPTEQLLRRVGAE